MNKLLLTAGVCLMFSMSGCATSGTGCCDSGRSSIFGQRLLQRKTPVQDTVRGWFQGDACNTCNPPAGMSANYGTNVAPLCESCDGTNPGIQFYGDPSLNAPLSSPSLVDPNFNNGGNITPTTPVGPIETGYMPSNEVIPPVF